MGEHPDPPKADSPDRIAAVVAAVVFFLAALRFGWASDDGFITIRSVDHLLHGQGFAINVDQRVQAFTSPLWALLCIPVLAVTRDPYWTLVGLGLACTAALCVVILRSGGAVKWKAVVTLLSLTVSVSFLHFSTSGLENSLSHLLVTLFTFERLRCRGRATRAGFLLAAALFLTRFDHALLVAPAVGLALFLDRRGALRLALPGVAAASAWLLFATLYYGFPFPNTAYAKLNTAIPLGDLVAQGLSYLVDSLTREPLVLSTIAASLAVSARRHTPSPTRALALGVLVYVVYVVYIGGDFMTGRFLTTCYLASLLLLVEHAASLGSWALPVAAAALVPFLEIGIALRPVAETVVPAGLTTPESGIVDERAFYVPHTGVAVNLRGRKWRTHPYTETFKKMTPGPERVILPGTIGLATYANTAEKHVVEGYALGDPFLARIRFAATPGWRIGHFQRDLPPGYIESMRSGKNVLTDPCLRTLYDRLRTVTQGPIWSLARFRAMLLLNTTEARCRRPAG